MRRGRHTTLGRFKWCGINSGHQSYPPTYLIGSVTAIIALPDPTNPFNTERISITSELSKLYGYDSDLSFVWWEWDWTSTTSSGYYQMRLWSPQYADQPLWSEVLWSDYWNDGFEIFSTIPLEEDPYFQDEFEVVRGMADTFFPRFWLPRIIKPTSRSCLRGEIYAGGGDAQTTAPRLIV